MLVGCLRMMMMMLMMITGLILTLTLIWRTTIFGSTDNTRRRRGSRGEAGLETCLTGLGVGMNV